MKKFLVLLFFLGLAAGFIAQPAAALTTDNFYITVTISHIDIYLRNQAGSAYGTWDLGTLNTSIVSTMAANSWGAGDQGVEVSNESNVIIDLTCSATNDAVWSYNTSTTTPGSEICVLRAKDYGSTAPASVDMSTGAVFIGNAPTDVSTNVPAYEDRYFYYEHTTPASTAVYSLVTHTVTVTGALP